MAKRDRTADFGEGADAIDLRGIDANAATAANETFLFAGAAAANSVWQGEHPAGGWTLFADITGDAVADFAVLVETRDAANPLVASDLVL